MAEFRLPKNSRITKGTSYPAEEGRRLKTFKIYRYDPDTGANPRYDSYTIDLLAPAAPAAVGGERGLFTFDEPERYTPHFEPDFGAPLFRMGPDPLSAFDLVFEC